MQGGMHRIVRCAFACLLAVDAARGAVTLAAKRHADPPVSDGTFSKIKQIISDQIKFHKAKLAEDTTEAELCRKERKAVKEKLEKQSAIVKEKMAALEKAREADKKALEQMTAEAKEKKKEAARKLKAAKALAASGGVNPQTQKKAPTLEEAREESVRVLHQKQRMAEQRAGQATPTERPRRKTEEAADMAKYELKEETKVLANYEKERELLHNKCVAQVAGTQSAEERARARDEEIEGLKSALDILDNPAGGGFA